MGVTQFPAARRYPLGKRDAGALPKGIAATGVLASVPKVRAVSHREIR